MTQATLTPAKLPPADRKALIRLLRLARKPLVIDEVDGAQVDLRAAAGDPPHRFPARLLRLALGAGLLRQSGDRISAGEEALAYLRRALVEPGGEAFQEQHRTMIADTVLEEGERHPVRRNLDESPLAALARLREKSGGPYFPTEAIEAGERLAADFNRGGLQPRITASWEPRLSQTGSGQRGGQADLADSTLAARDRVAAAMRALGPDLSGVALDICCFMKGLETVERERQWPARSAKLMLRTALMALARHYAPPAAPRHNKPRHWGAEGYRPLL
ncbi:hypothetical protein HFC70_24655 [Agrobacterium sp. a22-2]|uniref:DUF6456 domain-containing protein n=1 Tax=Agrobacterium sp. a22-2 TaxID=2283840 RepID=UPI0014465FC3|nr:DUF6456 domain-containing protein [Agrobacterium sp. a22-2]NKN39542.1 hypothetical protein [Agrobacterium sp. a22-2]